MRDFKDIQQELGLALFTESPLGTLYYVPVAPGAPELLVRRFDGDLPPALVPVYADLLAAAERWIRGGAGLPSVVRVDRPVEIGRDFIARPHRMGTSLMGFADDEDPPEPPDELAPMRARFHERAAAAAGPREELLATMLARSILEPTAKTIYSPAEEKFIIADIKPTRGELERWSALTDDDRADESVKP